ncbi:hypothetical protein, partial [Burkholderia thailandensis]|uniref:hypothetical protein n=1 Tax=Burkholderia thailandensis TaxID=57975 RepID=UPI001E64066C
MHDHHTDRRRPNVIDGSIWNISTPILVIGSTNARERRRSAVDARALMYGPAGALAPGPATRPGERPAILRAFAARR